MDKDTKTLILAFFIIIIIAVVGFVFSGIGYTTKALDDAVVTISPPIVQKGEYITINVIPGENGIRKEFTIRRANGLRAARGKIECGSYCCKEEVVDTYKTQSNWQGDYFMEFDDCKGNRDVVTADFEILP